MTQRSSSGPTLALADVAAERDRLLESYPALRAVALLDDVTGSNSPEVMMVAYLGTLGR